jgi:hypothetical protein
MSNHISFDSAQEVTLIAKETVSVEEVHPRRFIIDLAPVEDAADNICVHALIDGARVALKDLCGSDQSAANTAYQPAVDILVAQLKSAIESGDYNG